MQTFNFPEYYYISAFDDLLPVVSGGLPLFLLADTVIVLDVVLLLQGEGNLLLVF
jgi:hypothetical protein